MKANFALYLAPRSTGARLRPHGATPFRSAEQAWHWTMAALIARRDSVSRSGTGVARPCDPDDIIRSVDRLYRNGRIQLHHARILKVWGERQAAPDERYPAERGEALVWREALYQMEAPLRRKGIIS